MKKSRIKEMSMEVTVGTFMFIVLLALGFFTIILSRENIFSRSYPFAVVFTDVMGLREGDNVFVRGVDVGKIKSINVEPDGVHIAGFTEIPLEFTSDYRVEILPSSVLGGRYLNIYQGSEEAEPIPPATTLEGIPPTDLIGEASETVSLVRQTLEEGKVLENLQAAMQEIRSVTEKLNQGEGSLGKLMTDETMYNDLQIVTAELKEVATRMNSGEGTIGKLLADDQVYEDLTAIASDVRAISGRLERGEGPLGRLLASDDTLYEDLASVAASLREIADGINRGEGTLGKLVKDDALFAEAEKLLEEVRATVDDYREASPITTFTSILFGAF